jgi:dihydrofolate reductase
MLARTVKDDDPIRMRSGHWPTERRTSSPSLSAAPQPLIRVAPDVGSWGLATDESWLRQPSAQHRVSHPEVVNVRKVVVYELLSLDGVAEDPSSFVTGWDEVMDANLAAVIAAQDAVILGRRSYAEWAEFWPGSDIQPFAAFINGVAKFVATSAPLQPGWAHASVVDGGLAEFVRALKARPGGDIGVHASISVAQALLAAGVVDELRLVIAPRIAGRGRRLLDGLPSIQLGSIRSSTSPSGHLLADYRVIR